MHNISVEDLILHDDRRGISILKPYMPVNYCRKAAISIVNNPGTVFIITGFYIANSKCPETDGPPGAIAIARALIMLGYKVYLVTDKYSFNLLHQLYDANKVINFPLTDNIESKAFAQNLIKKYNPSLIISIERCGLNADGVYLNMNGIDISNYNAKIDYLFQHHPNTIGIGDGGNEIGMGNYANIISNAGGGLPKRPCITKTTHTIISSVSNWGGYGLVVELSKLVKRNLLITADEEAQIIQKAIKLGAVDGITQKHEPRVDGFSLFENTKLLSKLQQLMVGNT